MDETIEGGPQEPQYDRELEEFLYCCSQEPTWFPDLPLREEHLQLDLGDTSEVNDGQNQLDLGDASMVIIQFLDDHPTSSKETAGDRETGRQECQEPVREKGLDGHEIRMIRAWTVGEDASVGKGVACTGDVAGDEPGINIQRRWGTGANMAEELTCVPHPRLVELWPVGRPYEWMYEESDPDGGSTLSTGPELTKRRIRGGTWVVMTHSPL